MTFLWNKRGLAALGAVATVTCLTLFVVLPALATTAYTLIPPASHTGVTPTDVPIGGNGVCPTIFKKLYATVPTQNLHEYDNPNPQNAINLPSGNGDNVTFTLAVSGNNNAQLLAVTPTNNAVIAAIGIKGGNDTAAYDYVGRDFPPGVIPPQGWVPADSGLHAPASKYNGSAPTQWYGISLLNVCYRLIAPISGKVFNDANGSQLSGQTGIDGAQVTITDTTTGGVTTVMTDSGGRFLSNQPISDSYTVCPVLPPGYTNESVPTSGQPCSNSLHGYAFALDSSGSSIFSSNNFGFQASTTISGHVYRDNNSNAVEDNGDTALAWTVDLFKNGGSTPAQSLPSTGNYSFTVPVDSSASYRVCVQSGTPPSGSQWAQSQPLPSSANPACASPEFGKGYDVTPSSTTPITDKNFGNAVGVAGLCDVPFGTDLSIQIQTATCKTGIGFVFGGNTSGSNQSATVWTSVHTNPTPIVEKVTFDDPISGGGAMYHGLRYIDNLSTDPATFPFDLSMAADMPFCNFDPRSSGEDFTLLARYGDPAHAAEVLPGSNTSCAISIFIQTPTVTTSGIGKLVAFVYTSADGGMAPH